MYFTNLIFLIFLDFDCEFNVLYTLSLRRANRLKRRDAKLLA